MPVTTGSASPVQYVWCTVSVPPLCIERIRDLCDPTTAVSPLCMQIQGPHDPSFKLTEPLHDYNFIYVLFIRLLGHTSCLSFIARAQLGLCSHAIFVRIVTVYLREPEGVCFSIIRLAFSKPEVMFAYSESTGTIHLHNDIIAYHHARMHSGRSDCHGILYIMTLLVALPHMC
jgi:hypothetical protein